MSQPTKRSVLHNMPMLGVLTLAYIVMVWIGQTINPLHDDLLIVWHASGFSVAILVLLSWDKWPSIWIGTLVIALLHDASPLTAAIVASGNAGQSLLAYWLLKRADFQPALERTRDVIVLAGFAAFLSTLVGATVGIVGTVLGGRIAREEAAPAWFLWWVSDAMYVILFAPVLLTWYKRNRVRLTHLRVFELALWAAGSLIICLIVFEAGPLRELVSPPLAYLLFPILIWPALRFGQRGSVLAVLVITFLAFWQTAQGIGPFAIVSLRANLVFAWVFMGVAALTSMLLAAAHTERLRVESRFRQLFEAAPIGMTLSNLAGQFQETNPAFRHLVGYSEEELKKLTFLDITTSEDRPANRDYLNRVLRGEEHDYHFEKRYVHKDGHLVDVLIHTSILRDLQGNPAQFIGQAVDIHRRVEAEAALLAINAQLATSRDTLNRLIQQLPIGIQVFDTDGLCVDVNPAHLAIFGLTDRDSLVGKYNIFTDPLAALVGTQQDAYRVLQGELVQMGDLNFDLAKGDPRFAHGPQHVLRVTLFPVFDDQGQISNFVGINVDVTEQKKIEQALRDLNLELERRVQQRTAELQREQTLLQAIFDSMGEGVLYIEEGRILYANYALTELVGYSAEELLNETQITPKLNIHIAPPFVGSVRINEQKVKRHNGSTFDAVIIVTAISGADHPIGTVAIVRDVTAEKRLQEQKTRFISNASHELRTPLQSLKTRLYLLKKQPEMYSSHLAVLERAVDYMTELLEDLLDVGRFERGVVELERQEVALQPLIQNVIDLERPLATEKQITLSAALPEETIRAYIDPKRMMQVVLNLIANAINYTPPAGRVHLSVRYLEAESKHYAVIDVEDTGSGIEPEYQERVFEPFFRIHENVSRGTGLGLTISREIVHLHGGRITVSSTLGQGSTFSVWLELEHVKQS